MIIIFGFRSIRRAHRNGQFVCPSCKTVRGFTERSVTRFFTLFFIPVIPLKSVRYAECTHCNGAFKASALPALEQFATDLIDAYQGSTADAVHA